MNVNMQEDSQTYFQIYGVDYMELSCIVNASDEYVDIVIARLADYGYEMFEETKGCVKAYIPALQFSGKLRMSLRFWKSDGSECKIFYSYLHRTGMQYGKAISPPL